MQLVTDRLKNPCLDYVQHVLFSVTTASSNLNPNPDPNPNPNPNQVPTASFTAGGTTYSSFAAVREAFLQAGVE